jgi:hypothetical protein
MDSESEFPAQVYYDADRMSSSESSEASSPRPRRPAARPTAPPPKKRKRELVAVDSDDDSGEKNVACAKDFTTAAAVTRPASEPSILPLFGGKGKKAAHVKLLRPSTLAGLSVMYRKRMNSVRCTPLDAKPALEDLVIMLNIVDAFLNAHAKLAGRKYHVCKSESEQHIRLLAKHYNTK